jgi:multidrug efflux pump subunit AcrA (membrane-fusion protein)
VITEDGQPLLKAGMYARVTLPTGLRQRALLVPKDALTLGGGPQPIVYVVESGGEGQPGKARSAPVEVGAAVGGLVQVRGQLAAGEMVVVQGNERLRPPFEVIVQRVIPTEGAADGPSTSSLQP